MPLQEHVDTLRSKHSRLEELIDEELHRPLPDQTTLSRLKKEKLRIKEALQRVDPEHGDAEDEGALRTLN